MFKLDPAGNETVLFYFQEFVNDLNPNGGLVQDAVGNLYGTVQGFEGEAFKLDTDGNLTQLPSIGGTSLAGFIIDAAGNLYGTTYFGGKQGPNCQFLGSGPCGTVFKLDPSGNLTTLYEFGGGADGDEPYAGLVRDAAGNLYGTAAYGGTVNSNCPVGCGVVFKITP